MWMRNSLALILTSSVLSLAEVAAAAPEYRVSVVGPVNSRAWDINSRGVVVGRYTVSGELTRAFLSRGKGWVDLGTLGGISSRAVAINDRGEVVGNWVTSAGQWRGAIWFRGRARDIGVIGGANTYYWDINNAGYSVAYSAQPGDGAMRSYLRAPNGRLRNIGYLPYTPPTTEAFALNNRNQVAGASGEFSFPEMQLHGFIWTRGVMRDVGGLETPTVVYDINDRGQATGGGPLPGEFRVSRAFFYSNGRLTYLDRRPENDFPYSQGYGINNRGYLVGESDDLRAFIYRGRRMQSLTPLVDPAWRIDEARSINDAGQIAATATRGGLQYAVRLDLIRPSAEPAPVIEPDDDAPLLTAPLSPEQAAAEARLDAEAQAREVTRPVEP